MLTRVFCYFEAWRHVELKVPEKREALEAILRWVRLVPEAKSEPWMEGLLPEKDVPVLAAVAVQATHPLTGYLRHFAPLMAREDLPLRVLTPGDFTRTARP